MSKYIATKAIDGAVDWVARADAKLDQTIAAKGEGELRFAIDVPREAPVGLTVVVRTWVGPVMFGSMLYE